MRRKVFFQQHATDAGRVEHGPIRVFERSSIESDSNSNSDSYTCTFRGFRAFGCDCGFENRSPAGMAMVYGGIG
jgi:hypothetical protein